MYTIGVNDAALNLHTDEGFTMDSRYYQKRAHVIGEWGKPFVWCSLHHVYSTPIPKNVTKVLRKEGPDFSTNPGYITGHNSGHCAVNYALLRGFKSIYLTGFDLGASMGHWHSGYPEFAPRTGLEKYEKWRIALDYAYQKVAERWGATIKVLPPTNLKHIPHAKIVDGVLC